MYKRQVLAYVLPFLCILSFILQLVTISLVYSAVLYKETATGNAWELEERAAYYAGLERSLTDLQRVRHDIKIVFVTMGGFVDRSDDPEMKAFFWEKIQPFAGDVIRRSELFARLKSIPSEPLRAFLYAKAEQAAQCGVVFHMEVRVVPEQFRLGMDVIDLTRVLGILLDNATEEAALVPSGQVRMTVTTQAGGATYRIANSITQATREQGVVLGRTTKGTGRGNGLAIVDALLAQYDNVLLSSLIVEEGFVQALNIETEVCNRIERGGGIVERPL